jgi:hypothetical protein
MAVPLGGALLDRDLVAREVETPDPRFENSKR